MATMQKTTSQMQGKIKTLKINLPGEPTRNSTRTRRNNITGGDIHTDGHMGSAAMTEKAVSEKQMGTFAKSTFLNRINGSTQGNLTVRVRYR